MNICELCGNDAHFGYDCSLQVPFVYNENPCFDQNFDNNFPLTSPSFSQQYLCCENCGGPHAIFQCQPQYPDIHQFPQETSKEILQAREDLMEAIQAFLKECDLIPPNEKCMALLLAEERFLKIKQTMEEEQNQPEVMQELLLKLMNDLQILKGIQQEKKEPAAQSFTPYWNFSMIDDEEARENFMKDICTFLRNWNRPTFYDYDDDEDDSILLRDIIARYSPSVAITSSPPVLPTRELEDSLIMGDKHLDTIPEKESDELIKSSVENLVPIPSESEDFSEIESECDMPVCDDFTTFSNPLFDLNDDFTSSDDESLSDEDVPMENFKIYSNPLFDDEDIISSKIDPHYFNFESNLIESLLNRDIINYSSTKFDFLLEEFSGELAHIDPIPPRIVDTDLEPKEEIRLIENLLYENSSSEERNSKIADTIIKSLSPPPILVEDSDSLMEEIDLFLASNDSMPPGIENDDYDSEGDIHFLEELLSNDSPLLPENESSNLDHFNDPSSPRPPPEPPDVCLNFEPDAAVINNFDELNEDECFYPGGGYLDFDDSRPHGFVHLFELHILSFI
ncbi:hypothetical protein Tco_0821984 [Tanacetum coccineum]|uniref:CCHC-type domain-containing protein n=1 Tax=Tanacetum coccineum TaxID=301880 RepID=A0ABQ5ADR9_9ASTR